MHSDVAGTSTHESASASAAKLPCPMATYYALPTCIRVPLAIMKSLAAEVVTPWATRNVHSHEWSNEFTRQIVVPKLPTVNGKAKLLNVLPVQYESVL
jgi:hypothetical protein